MVKNKKAQRAILETIVRWVVVFIAIGIAIWFFYSVSIGGANTITNNTCTPTTPESCSEEQCKSFVGCEWEGEECVRTGMTS